MARDNATEWLAAPRIGRILALLGLLSLPHMLQMPPWASAAVLLIGAWRLWIARRGLRLPPLLLRLLLAGALATALALHYGSFNGLEAGMALLVAMTAMKALETRSRRDCRLLIYLGFLLLLGQVLRSQDMPWLVWMLLGVVLNLAVLIDLQHPQALLPMRGNLRRAGLLALKAIPLALVFFVLFPRIPGPLWGLPQEGSGRTGLSDSMEPGNVSQLAQSDAVAFRVRFDGPAPPNRELYWRGPVLSRFDGIRWDPLPDEGGLPVPALQTSGPLIDYEIQLEAHGRKYLLALDMPLAPLPAQTYLNADYVLKSRQPVMDARLLPLRASTRWELAADAPRWQLGNYRRMPSGINPQTQALAANWAAESADSEAFVDRVLRHFRQQPYRYTLEPPRLTGRHRIDQFLFETRAGFCEHYAAAFVVLMRFVGLPARVVTGYQGSEPNGDYHIVRQSDAHAWAEVWIEGRGWMRVDPTAAIAPERIEYGLGAALGDSALLPGLARGYERRRDLAARLLLQWDRLDAAWNRTVLAFGPSLQRDFLRRFGVNELRDMLYALVAAIALVGLLLAAQVTWAHRRKPEADPLRAIRERLLRRAGIELPPAQRGPRQIEAALREAGLWDADSERLLAHYTRLRYARREPADPELLRGLRRALRAWPARRRPPRAPGG